LRIQEKYRSTSGEVREQNLAIQKKLADKEMYMGQKNRQKLYYAYRKHREAIHNTTEVIFVSTVIRF
jgi:hypothetical protein